VYEWIVKLVRFFQKSGGIKEMHIGVTVPFGGTGSVIEQRLLLWRRVFTDVSTIGDLMDNGKLVSYVLEDAVRKHKIPKTTAIPMGTYEIKITKSPRFSQAKKPVPYLPELLGVAGFTGVRIHHGNTASHTDGCLIVGLEKDGDWVGHSRLALAKVIRLIRQKLKRGPLWLTIAGGGYYA
jgi:hypothetical protein